MKGTRLVHALEYLEEDLIADAAFPEQREKRRPVWMKWGAAAACLCLCVLGIVSLWRPGMGDMTHVYQIAAQGESVYYSVWKGGAFHWNPAMGEPELLAEEGTFFETEAGLILYAQRTEQLWQVRDSTLTPVGSAGIGQWLEYPVLLGILDGWAYWTGEPKEGGPTRALMRTQLTDGAVETLIRGRLGACALRGDTLYYQMFEENHPRIEKIYGQNVETGAERLLLELPVGVDGGSGQVHFFPTCIVIVGGENEGLYRLGYEGGEPEFLTEWVPITGAMAVMDGKLYYETAFGENESELFASGKGFYSEELVSVDLETGEGTRWAELELGQDNGTTRFTLTELAVTKQGVYFTDPSTGLYYYSIVDDQVRQLCRE